MTTDLTVTSFENLLDELEGLAREHLLFFRVQVGDVFLRHFWADDPVQFSSHAPSKESRFELFFEHYEEPLKRYGLSRRQAIDSVRVALVVRSLPAEVAQRLFLSQIKQLGRLHDATQRVQLAQAALTWDWSLNQLRDAVETVRAGLPLAATAICVPPTVQPPTKVPSPGRLVTRAERLASDLRTWADQWSTVDPSGLRLVQRRRLAKAADELEAEVQRLRRVVAAAGGASESDAASATMEASGELKKARQKGDKRKKKAKAKKNAKTKSDGKNIKD